MSDPYVVLVTIDTAPWDSDAEVDVKAFAFDTHREAQAFYDEVLKVAEIGDNEMPITVFVPLPTTHADIDIALAQFKEALDAER